MSRGCCAHYATPEAERAIDEYRELFTGENPTIANPVHEELAKIQAEIRKTTEEFKSGVAVIRNRGWKAILGDLVSSSSNEDSEDPTGEHEHGTADAKEPEFSILPIDLGNGDELLGMDEGAQHVILGKSVEQVKEAVIQAHEAQQAEEQERAHLHVEL